MTDLEYYRKRLLDRKKALMLEDEMGASGAATVELDQTSVGRVSRVDALQAQAVSVAAKQRRAEELRQISAALVRVDEGEYGYCLDCGDPISPERLEIDLSTKYCVKCASAREKEV
jgi:DnaK suppressor protein